jgi:NDP-sugar pyrophosphorylase family protein
MKERVTLTLDSGILSQVDSQVDGYRIKNRSHAVELLLIKAIGTNVPKTCVILAGGRGTRLKPITNEIPKPMIPVHDKPVIEHNIDLLKKYGIRRIIISLGYKGDKIRNYFGDGRRFGVNISYVEEKEPLGTAGALCLTKPFLNDTFVVCNADELKSIDLIEMFLTHKDNKACATVALTTVDDPCKYGVAKLKGNRIIDFEEKPKKVQSRLINAGLCMLEPDIFKYIPQGACSLEKEIFPKLAKEGLLFGYPFDGQWFDTGTMENYEEAMQKWIDIE